LGKDRLLKGAGRDTLVDVSGVDTQKQ